MDMVKDDTYRVRRPSRFRSGVFTPIGFLLATIPLVGCAAVQPPDVYSGCFRQGFEQSDFYTLEGEGPYWLTAEEDVYAQLQDHLVRKEGRGSYIATRMTVRGDLHRDGGYGLGYHDTRIHVVEIVEITSITTEAFERFAMSVIQADSSSALDGSD